MSALLHFGIQPGRDPLGRHPRVDTPLGRHRDEMATTEDGTHPTGMHSCVKCNIAYIVCNFLYNCDHFFVTVRILSFSYFIYCSKIWSPRKEISYSIDEAKLNGALGILSTVINLRNDINLLIFHCFY